MMDNSNKRIFTCDNALWQPCNELASRLNISMDGLICEALTFYYQQQAASLQNGAFFPVSPHNASLPATPQTLLNPPQETLGQSQLGGGAATFGQSQLPINRATAAPGIQQASFTARGLPGVQSAPPSIPSVRGASPLPPPSVPPSISGNAMRNVPPAAPPPRPPSIFDNIESKQQAGGKLNLASLSASQIPPATPGIGSAIPASAPPAVPGAMPPLYVVFANQRYLVSKDKYIIGRSSQVADLVIRDGNISRKHCAVIFTNGAYYIHDLGSTNGLEYQGQQIETKRIDEGDQFNICEFVFKFTYK